MARQRLGQHFLSDENWREQIAREIGVSRNTSNFSAVAEPKEFCWIEIGAGHGEMTSHLAATGTPVYAIEIDSSVARGLQHLTERYANLTIVSGDVLKTDIAKLASGRRVHVYGNLPYYITSPILHHLFRFADIIDEVHIVIQTEVAERLVAEPDGSEYGYLSVATRLYSTSWKNVSGTSLMTCLKNVHGTRLKLPIVFTFRFPLSIKKSNASASRLRRRRENNLPV